MNKEQMVEKFEQFAEKYNPVVALAGLQHFRNLTSDGLCRSDAIEQMFDEAGGAVEREDIALLADIVEAMLAKTDA